MRVLRTFSFGLFVICAVALLIRVGFPQSLVRGARPQNTEVLTRVGVVAGILGALFAFPSAVESILGLLDRCKRRPSPLVVCRARNFDPKDIVNAYDVRQFHEYWPIEADAKIDEALRNRNHVLLVGRQHIGKSRAAAHHIRRHFGNWWTLNPWYVILPDFQSLDKIPDLQLSPRRYVLLLDDVDKCLANSDVTGTGPLQLIHHVRAQARELVVIATMRTVGPVFSAVASCEYLLDRWCHIEIGDWSDEKGARLAKRLNTNMDAWDGTPLSIIQPSPLMAACYHQAAPPEKKMLRLLKLFVATGFSFVPRRLFLEAATEKAFAPEMDQAAAECAIERLRRNGFVSRADVQIVPYPRYVEIIDDWEIEPWMLAALKNVIVRGKWTNQLLILAGFLANRGDLEAARDACHLAVELEPDVQRHYYRLGVILARQRKWKEAEQAFRHAIDLCPEWASVHYRLADVLREQGKNHEAWASARRAMDLCEEDTQSRLSLATIHRLEGRADTAIEELCAVLEDDRGNAQVWYELGRAYRDSEQWEQAEKAHREAIALRPNWGEAWFGLAEPLRAANKLDDAEKAYRKAIELGPNMPEAYAYLSKLLQEMKRSEDEVEQILRDGIAVFPENARLRSFLGSFLSGKEQKRNREALEQFEKAISYEPSYIEARVGLAAQERLLRRNNPQLLDRAIENNNRVIEVDPNVPEAHFGLGLCYLNKASVAPHDERIHYFQLAAHSFDKATKLRPDYAAAYYHRAIAIEQSAGSRTEAIQCAEKARTYAYDLQKVERLLKTLRSSGDLGTESSTA